MRSGKRINLQMRKRENRRTQERRAKEWNLERAARVVLIHEVHVLRRVDADPNKSHSIIVVEILHLNAHKAMERGIRGNPLIRRSKSDETSCWRATSDWNSNSNRNEERRIERRWGIPF